MRLIIEPIVRAALLEDLGRAGDITTEAIVPEEAEVEAVIAARQPGVVAGLEAALLAFELIDPTLHIERLFNDGARISRGDIVARINGRAMGVLAAERTALNLLSRMSGVATATRALADAIAGSKAKIVCTRKTTPGLRTLEKEAVRLGGGANHRFGLDDAMLIKDNHIALAGRRAAGARTRQAPCRPSGQDRARGRHPRPARRGAGGRGRCRAARQHDAGDDAPGRGYGRRPGDYRSLRSDQSRNRPRRRRNRRRSDLLRLDHHSAPILDLGLDIAG